MPGGDVLDPVSPALELDLFPWELCSHSSLFLIGFQTSLYLNLSTGWLICMTFCVKNVLIITIALIIVDCWLSKSWADSVIESRVEIRESSLKSSRKLRVDHWVESRVEGHWVHCVLCFLGEEDGSEAEYNHCRRGSDWLRWKTHHSGRCQKCMQLDFIVFQKIPKMFIKFDVGLQTLWRQVAMERTIWYGKHKLISVTQVAKVNTSCYG